MTKTIVLLLSLFIGLTSYLYFVQDNEHLHNIRILINNLKEIEVLGVSGDEDIGITAVIKPLDSLPVGLEGVNVEAFNSTGKINVQFIGNHYVYLFRSDGNTPAFSSIDISKPLNEGGLLENPIASMHQIAHRFHELKKAFFNLPTCPKYDEITNSSHLKFKICITEKKNSCSSNGKIDYKCMLENVNQWPRLD